MKLSELNESLHSILAHHGGKVIDLPVRIRRNQKYSEVMGRFVFTHGMIVALSTYPKHHYTVFDLITDLKSFSVRRSNLNRSVVYGCRGTNLDVTSLYLRYDRFTNSGELIINVL